MAYIEVQGTAEGEPFSRELLDELLELAANGCSTLTALQQAALAGELPARGSPARRFGSDVGLMNRVVPASRNAHKVAGGPAHPADANVPIEPHWPGRPSRLRFTTPETGATFAENALIKAQSVSDQTGFAAPADDLGWRWDAQRNAGGPRRDGQAATGMMLRILSWC